MLDAVLPCMLLLRLEEYGTKVVLLWEVSEPALPEFAVSRIILFGKSGCTQNPSCLFGNLVFHNL